MDAGKIEVTLKDMANMALGTAQLKAENIALLYRLIEIIMRKMDCQKGIITLNGINPAVTAEKLAKSEAPLLKCIDFARSVGAKVHDISRLEEQLHEINEKYDQHHKAIRKGFNHIDIDFTSREHYCIACEDMYTLPDSEKEEHWRILRCPAFVHMLLEHFTKPMLEHLVVLEYRLTEMQKKLLCYQQHIGTQFSHKINLIGACINVLQHQNQKSVENEALFMDSMIEVDAMLEAKLKKIHIAPLRKYIREVSHQLLCLTKELQNQKSLCKEISMFSENGPQCISCLLHDEEQKIKDNWYESLEKNPLKNVNACICKMHTNGAAASLVFKMKRMVSKKGSVELSHEETSSVRHSWLL